MKKSAKHLDFVQQSASKLFRVFPSCGFLMRQSLAVLLIALSLTASGCCGIGGCPASNLTTGTEGNPDGLNVVETTEDQTTDPASSDAPQKTHKAISSRKLSAKIEPYSWEWLARENARKRAEAARVSRMLTICQDCKSDVSSR